MNNFGTGSNSVGMNDFLDEAPNIDDILREFKEESGDLDWVDAYTSFEDETDTMDDESSDLLARLREISDERNVAPTMPAETPTVAPTPPPTPPVARQQMPAAPSLKPAPVAQPAAQPMVQQMVQQPVAQPMAQSVAPVAPQPPVKRIMQSNQTPTAGYQYDVNNNINFTALINNPAAQTWTNFALELKNLSLEVMTAGAVGAMTPDVARSTMSALIDAVGEANKARPNAAQINQTIHDLMLMTMGQIPLISMCADVNLAACLLPTLK